MKNLSLLCLGALTLGTSSVAVAASSDPVAAPVAAALPAPKPGMGQVVIFRPSSMGFAVKCTVRENGAMVGRVGAGKY